MKIVFLSAAKSIHTVKWVNAMSDRGHEVYLIYNKGHEPNSDLINEDVKLYCMRYGGSLGYYFNASELHREVKKIQPDIVHVHYASGYGTLARVAKIGPTLLSVWGSDVYDFPNESKVKNYILKKNIRYADKLASTSKCMALQLQKTMNDNSIEVKITPFGVDTKRFDSDKYEKKKSDSIVIGNIKALSPKYGISELIYAIKALLSDNEIEDSVKNMLCVDIYGDGEQKEELIELTYKLGLGNIVHFKGKIPNTKVPEVLSQIDIFCAMSQLDSESFGVAVVEAMAMKKPVVASDVDGFSEVVEDRKTGIIVKRTNIVQCKEALKQLILDQSLRIEMGENGRKRVLDLYDWKKNVDYMECIYRDFLKVKDK